MSHCFSFAVHFTISNDLFRLAYIEIISAATGEATFSCSATVFEIADTRAENGVCALID